MVRVTVMVVVVLLEVGMYIMGEQNLCWFHSQTCTPMMTEFSVGNSRFSSCPAYTVY